MRDLNFSLHEKLKTPNCLKNRIPFLACMLLGGELVGSARLPNSQLTAREETVHGCIGSVNLVGLGVGLGLSSGGLMSGSLPMSLIA